MNTGLLWYDDDKKRPVTEKVERAVNYYFTKLGHIPTECHVHPTLAAGAAAYVFGCRMVADRTIMVNHFWLGVGAAESEKVKA